MRKNIVEIKNVSKKYGNTKAVDNISLNVKEGDFFSILGPSGCGKTTTLRMVGGFIEADEGDIFLDSQNMKGVPPNKRDTSLVFQNLALFPHMNVKENIVYGLRKRGISSKIIEQKFLRIIKIVNLVGLEKRKIKELSGGQQQRVALARSLIIEPKILLLDEPLANLDKKLRIAMQLELKEIQKRTGTTFLYVTHDQSEALTMSDMIAVMNEGQIIQIGTPSEIYNTPVNVFVADFIGAGNFLKIKKVFKSGNDNILLLENEKGTKIKYMPQHIPSKPQETKVIINKDKNEVFDYDNFENKLFMGENNQVEDLNLTFFIRPEKIKLILPKPEKQSSITESNTNNNDIINNKIINEHKLTNIGVDYSGSNINSAKNYLNSYSGIINSVIFEGPDIRVTINSNKLGSIKTEIKNDNTSPKLREGQKIKFYWDICEGILF